MKRFLLFILLLLIIIVIVMAYLGFIPVLSEMMGSTKPRDLGVHPAPADLVSAQAKLKGVRFEYPLAASVQKHPTTASGSVDLNIVLTAEEITALIQSGKYRTWPFRGVQVRINPDGSAEAAGMLILSKVGAYAQVAGADAGMVLDALNSWKIMQDVPFYVAGKGSVTNGKVTLDVQKAELGRLAAPEALIASNKPQVIAFLERGIANAQGVRIKSLRVDSGKVVFNGSLPNYSPHWQGQP